MTILHTGPRLVPHGRDYELLEKWGDVPAGFRTDGASIPRLLWPIVGSPFAPEVMPAAVRHDFDYRFGATSRDVADRWFRRTAISEGVAPWRAWLLWSGVRAFGWLYWRRCRYGRGVNG